MLNEDLERLKKALKQVNPESRTRLQEQRGLLAGIFITYIRMGKQREGTGELEKLCPDTECHTWVLRQASRFVEVFGRPRPLR